MDNNRYLERLTARIIELLLELHDDDERLAMMRKLGVAAEEGGLTACGWAPRPDLGNPWQWASALLSTNDRAWEGIRAKRKYEHWPRSPDGFENLDEIVSAFRPLHSLE